VDQVDALAMPRLFAITTTNNNLLLQKQINARRCRNSIKSDHERKIKDNCIILVLQHRFHVCKKNKKKYKENTTPTYIKMTRRRKIVTRRERKKEKNLSDGRNGEMASHGLKKK
jgi:hypothetical protein